MNKRRVRVPEYPLIDLLEPRRMLSSAIARGIWTVTATPRNDSIQVGLDPAAKGKVAVWINGKKTSMKAASLKQIRVDGLAGNDTIKVLEKSGTLTIPLWLKGGDGSDTIIAGTLGAKLDGGNGDDVLTGGVGNDTILGGAGNDFATGGGGNDLIRGGAGDDQLYGDAGNDSVYGEQGNDSIGGDGEDRLWFQGQADPAPETGNDSLNGGPGNDWITGGDESDTLHDQPNGKDTLTGGGGNDVVDARSNFTYDSQGNATADPATQDIITDPQAGQIIPQNDFHQAGITSYAMHIHILMRIYVDDGTGLHQVVIPGGMGDFHQAPVLHKHDNSDTFHIHTGPQARDFTLAELFRNWGVTFSSRNLGRYRADAKHPLTVTINGQRNTDFGNYVFHDGDKITIRYNTTQGSDPRIINPSDG